MAKNEALKRAIENIKLSHKILQSDIARVVGVKNTYLSDVINGRVPLSENLAEKFSEQFQIDKSLLTGEGEMLKSGSTDNVPSINFEQKGVPYYDVDFIAGFDLVVNDQTVNPDYYINFRQYNNASQWVNITGHSMEPLMSHGDIMAIKEIADWETYILYGEVYAIVTNEYRTVKKVRKGTTNASVKLVPINPEFDEQEIPKSIIKAVYQVNGCMKKIF